MAKKEKVTQGKLFLNEDGLSADAVGYRVENTGCGGLHVNFSIGGYTSIWRLSSFSHDTESLSKADAVLLAVRRIELVAREAGKRIEEMIEGYVPQ